MAPRDPQDLLPLTPVDLHILLALAEGERHGYAIAQEVERRLPARSAWAPARFTDRFNGCSAHR